VRAAKWSKKKKRGVWKRGRNAHDRVCPAHKTESQRCAGPLAKKKRAGAVRVTDKKQNQGGRVEWGSGKPKYRGRRQRQREPQSRTRLVCGKEGKERGGIRKRQARKGFPSE